MEKWRAFRNSTYEDAKGRRGQRQEPADDDLQIILIVGVSRHPVAGYRHRRPVFASPDADSAEPMVYIPIEGTLERYTTVITQMRYFTRSATR